MESMVGVTTFGKVVGWRYIPFNSIENEREILRVIVIGSPFLWFDVGTLFHRHRDDVVLRRKVSREGYEKILTDFLDRQGRSVIQCGH